MTGDEALPADQLARWHDTLQLLAATFEVGFAALYRAHPDGLEVLACVGSELAPGELVQADPGAAQVLASGEAVQLPDAVELGGGFFAALPIRHRGTIFGLLNLRDAAPRSVGEGQLALLGHLAAGVERDLELLAARQEAFRYRSALEAGTTGVLIMDPECQVLYANTALCALLGSGPDELYGLHWEELGSLISREQVVEGLEVMADGEPYQREIEVAKEDGTQEWMRSTTLPVVGPDEELSHLVEIVERSARAEIDDLARIDPLTGLPNRKLAVDYLHKAMARATRSKNFSGVLCVDLDDFGEINEELGADAGDRVLLETANRLRAALRETDTVASLWGNKYLAILTDLRTPADAFTVAELVRGMLHEPYVVGDNEIEQSCSIGMTIFPGDGDSEDELIERALVAMFRAKAEGHGNVFRHELADEEE